MPRLTPPSARSVSASEATRAARRWRALGQLLPAVLAGVAGGCAPLEEAEAPPALGRQRAAVVYGADHRLDVHAHPSPALAELARRSVVAVFDADRLREDAEGRVQVFAPSLSEAAGVCDDEAFAAQPVGPTCSGTLVAPDVVLTAGHCVVDRACADLRFVFGWHTVAGGAVGELRRGDVFACAEVLTARLDNRADHALVRLDRRVDLPRVPAAVRWVPSPVAAGTPVVLVGYPSGLPAKIDDGGRVTAARRAGLDAFFATVDAFGGNSGSGVFDAAGRLLGVLVSGNEDYVFDGAAGCLRVNRLDDDVVNAERAVLPWAARADLCAQRPGHALCAPLVGPWCAPCGGAGPACAADFACGLADRCVAPCGGAHDCEVGFVCRGGLCLAGAGAACEVADAGRPDLGPNDLGPHDLGPNEDAAPAVDAERPPDLGPPLDRGTPPDRGPPRDAGPGRDARVPWELGADTDAWAPPPAPPGPADAGRPPAPPPLDEDPGAPARGAEAPEWTPRQRPSCAQAGEPAAPGPGGGLPPGLDLALLGMALLGRRRRRRTRRESR